MAKTLYPELRDKDWLVDHYVNRCMSGSEIAAIVGCYKSTVWKAIKKHEIPMRRHTSKYPKLNDKDWLISMYVDEEKSCRDIAEIVGCHPGLIQNHLTYLNVEMRARYNTGTGEKASHWQGGRPIFQGYQFVYAPEHPKATKTRPYVQEHRLVMEGQLGRYLEPYEVVHHMDGDRLNNDPSNLVVKTRGKHVSEHFKASHEVLQARIEIEQLKQQIAELEKELEYRNPS